MFLHPENIPFYWFHAMPCLWETFLLKYQNRISSQFCILTFAPHFSCLFFFSRVFSSSLSSFLLFFSLVFFSRLLCCLVISYLIFSSLRRVSFLLRISKSQLDKKGLLQSPRNVKLMNKSNLWEMSSDVTDIICNNKRHRRKEKRSQLIV